MSVERTMNGAISPDHTNHPGWIADNCPHRLTITPRSGGVTSSGFACDKNGAHCLPKESCGLPKSFLR